MFWVKMKKIKFLVLWLVGVFSLFLGCMSGSVRNMEKNYVPSMDIPSATLAIYARYDNLSVANRDEFSKTFGAGNIREKFEKFINDSLPGAIRLISRFKTVQMVPMSKSYQFKDTMIAITKDKTAFFKIPKHDHILDFSNKPVHFILIMQNFFTRESFKEAGKLLDRYQIISCDYVLWDNVRGKLIASGTTTGKSMHSYSGFYNVTQYRWTPGLISMAHEIFKKSVFIKAEKNTKK